MYRKRIPFFLSLACVLFFINVYIVSFRNTTTTPLFQYDPAESVPLLLMGGLRGIAVDFLWARAIARHDEKKYYELLTINNLIARLQPNFPAIWIFQSWNMAYNISYEWDSPQNKWKWIYAGLEFAKKGAVKNPTSGDLFFELGYMYVHLFNERYFKYADYYRTQLKEKNGEDNYESAIYWFRKSLQNRIEIHNSMSIERTICHTLWCASLCAEKEGNFDKALNYVESSVQEWNMYRTRHPDDRETNVSEFINTLEKKKESLQSLTKKDVWE